MAEYLTHEHDVLVIGAGGAGLRAAIEASAAGVKTGVITKSLLGKAHTVMAEGGMAAAMGNVDDRDNWRVHFSDTMRGGQYLNNWRMAELHAKEAPDRVRELEAWGAALRPHQRRPNSAAQFRRPPLSAPGARRRPHRPRNDPHLQDHGIHLGIDVFMEHTVLTLLKDGDRIAGAFGYDRERGRFHLFRAKAVVLATGGIGRAFKITSNSWEYTGDGQSLAYHAGAALHGYGVRPVPSHRHGLAAQRARHSGHRRRARRRRRAAQQRRQALHVRRYSADYYVNQTADNEEEGWRYTQGDKNARRPPELLTRDHVARCIRREVKEGRGSPHGGVFLDIAWIKEKLPNAAEHIKKKLPSMYHQFKQLADIDITKEPMEVGPTTHYMMGGVRVDGDTQMSDVPGLFAAGECAAGLHGANRLGGNSLSDLLVFGKRAGEYAAKFAKANPLGAVDTAQVERYRARRAGAVRARGPPRIRTPCSTRLQDMMQDLVGIVRQRSRNAAGAGEDRSELKARADAPASPGNREYNTGWHTASICRIC